jgi:Fur family zinc uptake transcriptional regulator
MRAADALKPPSPPIPDAPYNRRMKNASSTTAHDHHDHDHGHAQAATPEAALALAEEYCRERGEKLTPIRRKVLELLLASGRATKAYSLLDDMRQIRYIVRWTSCSRQASCTGSSRSTPSPSATT